MEKAIRVFKEFFNQALKCERLGHDNIEQEIKIRKEPDSFSSRVVVEDYKAKIQFCKRCKGLEGEPYGLKYLTYYTSCSMPSSMWDDIREKGYVRL